MMRGTFPGFTAVASALAIATSLSACKGNTQASAAWWGENTQRSYASAGKVTGVRAPFGNPNSSTMPWQQGTAQNPNLAGQLPWANNNSGAGDYPPPPTIPPADFGGYAGLNAPEGSLPSPAYAQSREVAPGNPYQYSDGDYYPGQQPYDQMATGAPQPAPTPPSAQGGAFLSQPIGGQDAAIPAYNTSSAAPIASLPQGGTPGETIIRFPGNVSTISTAMEEQIQRAAEVYSQSGYRLLIEGVPSSGSSQAQSTARGQAGTVARYLISYGVPTTAVVISTGAPGTAPANTVTIRPAPYL